MIENNVKQAAKILWNAWQQGEVIDSLPEHYKPQTIADGYAIQAALAAISEQQILGWKIAATSKAGQQHIGVDGPLAGRLLAHKFHQHPATLPFGGNHMRVAEAEFAFRLGSDLPPREQPYHQEEVMAAVDALYPAIELPDSRFTDFANAGGAQLTADNACARQFILGDEATAEWRSIDLAEHPIILIIDGEVVTRGKGGDALGDPRIAMTWIANNHALQGDYMRAGQIVTTGVCGAPSAIAPGSHIVAEFCELGSVEAWLREV